LNRPQQPENDLHPDPARLRLQIQTVENLLKELQEDLCQLRKTLEMSPVAPWLRQSKT
jgi:hypothetical protein